MAPPITYNSGSTYTINWKLNPLPETSSLSGITGPDQPSRTEGRLSPASPSTILSPLIDIPFPLQGASTEEKVQDEEVQKKVNSYTENRNLLNPSFNNADTPKTLMTGMSLDDYRLPSSPTNTNTKILFQ